MRKKPPTDKPHIYKVPGQRKRWRCAITYRGEYIRYDASALIFAYRGILRRIVDINRFGTGGFVRRFINRRNICSA